MSQQTLWYGGSYVSARFLNVLLKFVLIHLIPTSDYGAFTKVYVYTTFLAVLFTYGMETAYFRFVQRKDDRRELFDTSLTSIILSTLLLGAAMAVWARPIASLWKVANHPEWIRWFAIILSFDALAAIPFARLRQEQRPVKYAFLKFVNILLQVVLTLFFLVVCPWWQARHPDSALRYLYDPAIGVGYAFIANVVASVLTMAFLYKEWRSFRLRINPRLWRQLLAYSLPMVVVGLGGMINEVMDRVLLDYILPGTEEARNAVIAIYQAGALFAGLINIFIQIFRMGAEPFFFNEMNKADAKQTYARVMKFFVIGSCWMFLGIVLFRNLWQAMNLIDVRHKPEYVQAFGVIPQLAMGYVCLGVYYNLSVWYKLTNKTGAGAIITLAGAALTLILNFWWIPKYGFVGCAWATLICYATMMIISFFWGQKVYKVPYEWKKLLVYLLVAVLCCLLQEGILRLWPSLAAALITGTLILGAFMALTLLRDREEFSKLPVIGRFLARGTR